METLDKAKKSKTYTICGYKADDNDPILRRFLELGFSVGEKVKIVSTSLQKKVFLGFFRFRTVCALLVQ